MLNKFYWLQHVDKMKEAMQWLVDWKTDARVAANDYGKSILNSVREGRSLKESIDSIRSLAAVYRDLPDGVRQLAVLQSIVDHARDDIADKLFTIVKSDELFRYSNKAGDTKD